MMKIILEFSNDGATWADVGGATHYKPMVGTFLGVDSIRADTTGRYWRVRTEDLTLTFTNSGVFATSTREVPMYQMTRDTYVSMPNKLSQSAVPLQYFFDKQELTPYLWFWPAIATIGPQIVIWIQRRLQDVGALTNRLDVPTRWLNAIIFRLSVQMCLELPKELSIEGRLDVLMQQAEAATREAEDGEVDGAPIRIMPNIGMYRG
jgi:hypothetical protein